MGGRTGDWFFVGGLFGEGEVVEDVRFAGRSRVWVGCTCAWAGNCLFQQ